MLIDGAPGVGKTTLSRKVSCMWAKGELLKEYWLVLLLHLRESTISKARTIDDFFYHEDSDLQRDVVKFVKDRSGDGVLIIFDGFDELSLYERSEESLFLHITKGKILPKCAVVVTSRPYASRPLLYLLSISRHIEILGFKNEQVKCCIEQKVKDEVKAKALCSELKDCLDVASICQIPLNCSIVLYVYEQENYSLPRTLTKLYDLFILHSLKRFIRRTQNSRAADRLLCLTKLPGPSREHFESLCYLAYKGLKDDKLVFTRDDVEEVFPANYQELDLPVLDLMTVAKSYSSRGVHDTYNFLHLTIQEFLGAYWVAHHSTDTEKLHFFREHLMDNRFHMVLLFLSGLTELRFPDAHSVFSKDLWIMDCILICHLLYESGNISILKYVSENCVVGKSISLFGSKFDALVVSHFVAYSGCQWDRLVLRPGDVKYRHKFFCTPECVNTSMKETLITFSPSPENTLPSFTLIEINKLNQDLMVLKLLDEIKQTVKINVHITICEDDVQSCRALTETLCTVFVGPHPVHRKCYTIKLDFLERMSFSADSCDRSPVYSNSKTNLCETLAECLAQNSFITHVTLNSLRAASDISCIFTRLSQNDSVSKLECFKVYNSPIPFPSPPVPMDFLTSLLNMISTNKSLNQISLDIPHLSDLICAQIMTIRSALISNTSLQKLTMCNGLYEFKRNPITKEVEFTNFPGFANLPLKYIISTSSANVSEGMPPSPPQAKQPRDHDPECNHYNPGSPKHSPTLQNTAHCVPYPYPSTFSITQPLKRQPQLATHPLVKSIPSTIQGVQVEHQSNIVNPLTQARFIDQDQIASQHQGTNETISSTTDLPLELDATTSSVVVYDQLPSPPPQAKRPCKHQEWSYSSHCDSQGHEQSPIGTQYIPHPGLPFPSSIPAAHSLSTISSHLELTGIQSQSATPSAEPPNSPLTSSNISQLHSSALQQSAESFATKEDSKRNISYPLARKTGQN